MGIILVCMIAAIRILPFILIRSPQVIASSEYYKWIQMIEMLRICNMTLWVSEMKLARIILFADINVSSFCRKGKKKEKR